jgi:hypothetical protein
MRVYHTKYPFFGGMTGEPLPRWPQDYELVAEIDQGGLPPREALDEAFRLTQSIEESWMENEGMQAFGTHRRSTSAGDAVALEDGGLYRCEMDGWTRIGTTWVGKTQGEAGRSRNTPLP